MRAIEKVRVAALEDLTPLIGTKVLVRDKEIGLFLTEDGRIFAVNNVCPHKQGPLSEGTVSEHSVFCPLHDQQIVLETGLVQEPDTGCVETYEVEIIDGDVYLCL